MTPSQAYRRNMNIDPRDPNFDPDMVTDDEGLKAMEEMEAEEREER